ncbi:MAG: hypothetical protein V6Z89_07675 [Desulfobacter sp.]
MSRFTIQNNYTPPPGLANINTKPYTPLGPYRLPEGVETVSDEEIANGSGIGFFQTRPYMMEHERTAAFEVTTAQGDKVTLTYERSEFRMDYLRPQGGYVPGLTRVHTQDDTFSMTVEGHLDEQEQADIAAFQKEIIAVIDDFLSRRSGGIDDAENLDMSRYDALTQYAAALDVAGSTSWASAMVKGVWNPGQQESGETPPEQSQAQTQAEAPQTDAPPQKAISETEPAPPAPGDNTAPEPPAAAFAPAETAAPLTYDHMGASVPEKSTPDTAQTFSDLGRITKDIFDDLGQSNRDTDYLEALNIMDRDFSGLIDQLIKMLEEPDHSKTYIDQWG